jgi:hypothetical protein
MSFIRVIFALRVITMISSHHLVDNGTALSGTTQQFRYTRGRGRDVLNDSKVDEGQSTTLQPWDLVTIFEDSATMIFGVLGFPERLLINVRVSS